MKIADIQIGQIVAVDILDKSQINHYKIRRGVIVSRLSKSPTLWAVLFNSPLTHTTWYAAYYPDSSRTGNANEYEISSRNIISPWEDYKKKLDEERMIKARQKKDREEQREMARSAIEGLKQIACDLGYEEGCITAAVETEWIWATQNTKSLCQLRLSPELLHSLVQMLENQIEPKQGALTQLLK